MSPADPPTPLLTIVVPALRPDRELRRCIDSIVLALPDADSYEVVLVVPGVVMSSAEECFPDLRVVRERRRGIYAAMNDGAAAARGSYLLFLGQDDIVLPGMRQALHALSQGPSALSCDVYWGERGVYSGQPSRWRLLGRNLCHQGMIYSRAAFERHGPMLRRMKVQADHLLNIRMLWDAETSKGIRHVAVPVLWYSGSGFSNLHRDPLFWRLYPTILRRHVGGWAAIALCVYRRLRGR